MSWSSEKISDGKVNFCNRLDKLWLLITDINDSNICVLLLVDAQFSGVAYQPTIQHSAITFEDEIYIYGGLNIHAFNSIGKLTLPSDVCNLLTDRGNCLASIGCDWCETDRVNGNGTCYSVDKTPSQFCNVSLNNTALTCNSTILQRRDCQSFTSCYACFAAFPGTSGSHCQWCVNQGCHQPGFNCILNSPKEQVQCLNYKCEASSCESCNFDSDCMWTRHFMYDTETTRHYDRLGATYPWNCFRRSLEQVDKYPASDKNECPARCSSYKTCRSCLKSHGKSSFSLKCVFLHFIVMYHSPLILMMLTKVRGLLNFIHFFIFCYLQLKISRVIWTVCYKERNGYFAGRAVLNHLKLPFDCLPTFLNVVKAFNNYDLLLLIYLHLGAEGGSKSCYWSKQLGVCFSPTFQYINCHSGDCAIISKELSSCPTTCSTNNTCKSCIESNGCGWCAEPGTMGIGVCKDGDLMGKRKCLPFFDNYFYI